MKSLIKAIGNTPLLKIEGVYVKWEGVNPTGSIKDRMAFFIIQKAEKEEKLSRGYTIIEATSGNTGISFSFIASLKGYDMIAILPEGVGGIKKKTMKDLGAEIVLVSKQKGFKGAIRKAKKLGGKTEKSFLPLQFENKNNPLAYEKSLAKEISDKISIPAAFVAGIGTGGTIMGVGKYLKKRFPRVKIFGVEAKEKNHKIEGISDGLTPPILNKDLMHGVLKVGSRDAIKKAKSIIKKWGVPVGISSGANLLAALEVKKKYNLENVVTVFPDRAERYPELW